MKNVIKENETIASMEHEIELKLKKAYDAIFKVYSDLKGMVTANTPNLKKLVDKLNTNRNNILDLTVNLDRAVNENVSFNRSWNYDVRDNLLESLRMIEGKKGMEDYTALLRSTLKEGKYVIKHSDLKKYPEKAKDVEAKAKAAGKDVEIDLEEKFSKLTNKWGKEGLLNKIMETLDTESKTSLIDYLYESQKIVFTKGELKAVAKYKALQESRFSSDYFDTHSGDYDDDQYLDSFQYVLETYINGNFTQLRKQLDRMTNKSELIDYLENDGSKYALELINWVARN